MLVLVFGMVLNISSILSMTQDHKDCLIYFKEFSPATVDMRIENHTCAEVLNQIRMGEDEQNEFFFRTYNIKPSGGK